jgi:hypothetical protein
VDRIARSGSRLAVKFQLAAGKLGAGEGHPIHGRQGLGGGILLVNRLEGLQNHVRGAAALRVHHFDFEGVQVGIPQGIETEAGRKPLRAVRTAFGGNVIADIQGGQRVVRGYGLIRGTVHKADGYGRRIQSLKWMAGVGRARLMALHGVRNHHDVAGF